MEEKIYDRQVSDSFHFWGGGGGGGRILAGVSVKTTL